MSSNHQHASASPRRADQQPKVGAPEATSDELATELLSVTKRSNRIASLPNDTDTDRSPSETKISTNSDATKSCHSPKDANSSSPSSNSALSSQISTTANNTIDSTNYQSVKPSDHYEQDEHQDQNQNVPFSEKGMHVGSPPNSVNNSVNSYANRNINDRNVSFSDHQNGQSLISRYRPQKYCAVCGDKAIACNFNAVTCESCKAFFRRNAFKEQRLKCLFDGRCVVDKVTRRFCSKCRLLKCFQIGMKREWILTDEQKQIKRVKILQNKQSKHHQQHQVSTSVLDVGSRSKSSGATSSASVEVGEEKYFKRQRTSSSSNYDDNMRSVQKCDASTSCPDEADLLSGQTLQHCTMAHQCQYCSLRLQSNGQPLHPVDQYQTNYRFHSSHRQYFDYNQRQQQDYQQQQQHFRYSQHAGHHYVGAQVSSSGYSQQQMAAAAVLKSSADVMNAAYAANIVSASATDTTHPPPGASQQAISGAACAVPQAVTNCCCPSFSEIIQSQRYNRPPGSGSSVAGTSQIIDHFANESPIGSNGSCGSGSQVVYSNPPPSMTPSHPANSSANKSKSNAQDKNAGLVERAVQPTDPTLDNVELHSMTVGKVDSSVSPNPFVKAFTSLKTPPTSINQPISLNSTINQKDNADSSSPKTNGAQGQADTMISHPSETTNATDAIKVAAVGKPTLPDGTPVDISKHIVWNGIVYAQSAIAESEMRARVEQIDFTETERQLVYEMIDAIRFMFEPTTTDRSFNDESLNDFVHFCDAALRRLIKTVKQIRAFRILGMDDQIMLLKTACFKILLLRSCIHYHDDIEGWRDRYGRIMPLSLLKKAKSMVYDKHKEILSKLSGPLRKDRMIMGFMSLVLLFDPRDNLKHHNSVGLDNLIYLCILRKYLIGTQPDPLEKYERLVEATQVINACNEEYNVFFSRNFQPEQITPLLIEIFDISINDSV